MENEQRCTILSMLFNTLLIICSLYCGTLIQNYTLICFGYYVMCDLIEDFLAYISSSANYRRASKKHPFGYGNYENYSSLAVGIIFLFLGIYILTSTIHVSAATCNAFAPLIMFGCLMARYVNAEYQFGCAKNEQSQMLMITAKDGIKSFIVCVVGLILLLLNIIIPLMDIIGAILIYEGLKIIIENILLIKGQNDTSSSIESKLQKIISKNSSYNCISVDLINVRNYYFAVIDIEISDEISIFELLLSEFRLKRLIKKDIANIRFIDFEVYREN